MVEEVNIDPVTRIEGHHGVRLKVEDGEVTNAWTKALMFRGFERIVVDRDPRDAPILLQRICGVCHNDHRLTSLLALEDAAGTQIPAAGKLLRNIVGALQYTYDHAVWAYALTGPDYCDKFHDTGLVRFNPITSDGVKEAVHAQRRLHQAMAEIGGKAPHIMTPIPGGITIKADFDVLAKLISIVRDVKKWVFGIGIGKSALKHTANIASSIIKDVKQKYKAGEPIIPPENSKIGNGVYDLVSLLVIMAVMGVADLGKREPRLLTYGTFREAGGEKYFPAGFYDGNKMNSLDVQKISEDVAHSWYSEKAGGEYVGDADIHDMDPNYGKEDAYSWGKAPRYGGKPVEVGPLARMVAKGLRDGWGLGDPLDLRKKLAGGRTASNALARNIARIQEEILLVDYLENKLLQLKNNLEKTTVSNFNTPNNAKGIGLREAPRGAVGHWITIRDGKTDNYQVIAPTTWNISPRDSKNNRGPIEQALLSTPVKDTDNPWNIIRTIHSFDPCLACTVQVFDGDSWTERTTSTPHLQNRDRS